MLMMVDQKNGELVIDDVNAPLPGDESSENNENIDEMEQYQKDLDKIDSNVVDYRESVDNIIKQYDSLYKAHIKLQATHNKTLEELEDVKLYVGTKYYKGRQRKDKSVQRQPQSRMDDPMLPNSPEPMSLM